MGLNLAFKGLTLILLTCRIWWAPNNASRWQMGLNLAFKRLTLILLTCRIWWAPNNASRWQMGLNLAFKGLTLILLTCRIWWAPNNASRWQVGLNWRFKGFTARTEMKQTHKSLENHTDRPCNLPQALWGMVHWYRSFKYQKTQVKHKSR